MLEVDEVLDQSMQKAVLGDESTLKVEHLADDGLQRQQVRTAELA